jgi:site-specific DNA recombinase
MNLEAILSQTQNRAVFYGRYSTEDQSIEAQRHVCQNFADKHGLIIVNDYVDEAISAFKNPLHKREHLDDLRKDAANGKFDCVLVYKADRLARKIGQHMELWSEFRRLGIPIILTESEKLYTTDSPHEIIVEIGLSSLESENTRVRTSDHYRMKTQQGIWLGGKLPYGYRYEDNPQDRNKKIICQIPHQIKVVQEVFTKYKEGYGFKRVAALIGEKNPNEKWTKEKVKAIITNPFYAGYTTSQRINHKSGNTVQPREEWVMGRCEKIPPCIEMDEWEACMDNFEQKKNGSGHPNQYITQYLFKDILVCGECGVKLETRNYTSGKKKKDGEANRKRRLYLCPKCGFKWEIDKLQEELIEDVLSGWFYQYKTQSRQDLQTEIMRKIEKDIQDLDTSIQSIKKEINKHQELLKDVEKVQRDDMAISVSVEMTDLQKAFVQSRLSLNRKIESLQLSIETKERGKRNLQLAYGDEETFKEFIETHTKFIYDAKEPVFRKLLLFLFESITVNKDYSYELHAVVNLEERGTIKL